MTQIRWDKKISLVKVPRGTGGSARYKCAQWTTDTRTRPVKGAAASGLADPVRVAASRLKLVAHWSAGHGVGGGDALCGRVARSLHW